MPSYQIEFSNRAVRQLAQLPASIQQSLIRRIRTLGGEPRTRGCKKLEGERDVFRVWVRRRYRIIYQVQDAELLVLILAVGPRKDIYR